MAEGCDTIQSFPQSDAFRELKYPWNRWSFKYR